MGRKKPTGDKVTIIRGDREGFDIRLSRVGSGPLVQVWIHEHGSGGTGIILSVERSDEFIEAYQDILDEIDNESERAKVNA